MNTKKTFGEFLTSLTHQNIREKEEHNRLTAEERPNKYKDLSSYLPRIVLITIIDRLVTLQFADAPLTEPAAAQAVHRALFSREN